MVYIVAILLTHTANTRQFEKYWDSYGCTKTEISLSRHASATPKPPPMNYRVNLISPQPLSCWGRKKDKRVAENPLFPVIMPGSDTSLELCAIIVSLSKTDSFTHQEISSIVRRDRSTISKILSHYKTHRTLSSTSRPGHPPKVSPRDQRRLLRITLSQWFLSARQVLDRADLSDKITPSHVNQIFRKVGLSARRPRMKPFLSDAHRERRLAWAMGRKDWGMDTWRSHIFTDESTFETGKPDSSILVRRRPGEEFNDNCIRPTFKSGRSTSNHWGGIHYSGRSELICLRGEGRMTATKYVEKILKEELAFFYAHVEAHSTTPPIVVEDNAPCHWAKIVTEHREM